MAKKNPIAAAAKKMAAAPVSNSVVTEVKAETKTEAPKAEEKKAEEPKKETKEVKEKELIAAVKKAYTKKGNKVGDIKTIEIYVKPEENAAYYVVNGVGADDYKIEL